ncbi:hypothetical protein H0B56_13515 [Haloechinothrix sp. YIM 98757]|uniref:5'-nucleotidase n=1 Tax=Haloechinothrix aidingensis TaxID=2752311 RepID=A0A838ABF1_9PSEU|nr:5'/3'-nucleotidase SurE [Haloechinothrix aidingensis]MBA0126564.1 hypothetical protein [Haloechinothrix aidingensis]
MSHPTGTRRKRRRITTVASAAATTVLVLATAGGGSVLAAQSGGGEPLHILLSNDDGVGSLGIESMQDALEDAGHRVTVVAPSSDRSGSGGGITTEPFDVERIADDTWAVDATPATSVAVGLDAIVDEPVDLVVSGINDGASNAGETALVSGTVGATTSAISELLGGDAVPAVALSSWPPADDVEEHFALIGRYGVELVEELFEHRGNNPVLTEPLALNVNFPVGHARDAGETEVTTQGKGALLPGIGAAEFGYTLEDGTATIGAAPLDADQPRDSDITAGEGGAVTITPFDGDLTAPVQQRKQVENVLGELTR